MTFWKQEKTLTKAQWNKSPEQTAHNKSLLD